MDAQQIVKLAESKFEQATNHFQDELTKLRTGRAHPSMLDGLKIEAYGSLMPLIQVGTVSVPESTMLQITPFDPTNLQAICAAIRADQQLGLNPSDDGRVVRVPVPSLTTERRQQIVKVAKEKMEEAFISMRTVRHDSLKSLKDGGFAEDECRRVEKQIDELMTKSKSIVESSLKVKEQEILTV